MDPMEWKDRKKITQNKSDYTTGRNKSKDIDEIRETKEGTETAFSNTSKPMPSI